MSNRSDWFDWIITQDNAGTLPTLASVTALLAPAVAPHDTPDARGNVAINTTNTDYTTKRHDIYEVALGLPLGSPQRGAALTNIGLANGRWGVGSSNLIGPCSEVAQGIDWLTNQPTYAIKQPETTVPDTVAWPPIIKDGHNLGKVQGVIDYLNELHVRTSGEGGNFG